MIDILIIAYNNPSVLNSTIGRLLSDFSFLDRGSIFVYDNGSNYCSSIEIKRLCDFFKVNYYRSHLNRGWGASINHFISIQNLLHVTFNEIILIMAHDAIFAHLHLENILRIFSLHPKAFFVSPRYDPPLVNKYNIFKSYYSRKGLDIGKVLIGQQTAFFARKILLSSLRYDEEFWIYGCEYEIQLRVADAGFDIYQVDDSIVVNSQSDMPSLSANMIYTINSLYLANKRHGIVGFFVRVLVVFTTMLRCFFVDRSKARDLFMILIFCINNRGKGYRSYRSNSLFFNQYPILSLSKYFS